MMNTIEIIRHDLAFRMQKRDVEIGFKDFISYYFSLSGGLFRHLVWFRFSQSCRKNRFLKFTFGIPAYLIEKGLARRYGIYANANISIGEGLHIVHGDSVYLNCVKIGKNFTIYPRVMMGAANGGLPTIGDNVTIYTGAVISGGITIGDGCIIGANAVVTKDCEPYSFYAGVPAKKIR